MTKKEIAEYLVAGVYNNREEGTAFNGFGYYEINRYRQKVFIHCSKRYYKYSEEDTIDFLTKNFKKQELIDFAEAIKYDL